MAVGEADSPWNEWTSKANPAPLLTLLRRAVEVLKEEAKAKPEPKPKRKPPVRAKNP